MSKAIRGIQRRPIPSQEKRQPDPTEFINQAKTGREDVAPGVLDALAPLESANKGLVKTFNIRLPGELHTKLEALSAKTGRSMHEIIMTIITPAIEKAHDRYVGE